MNPEWIPYKYPPEYIKIDLTHNYQNGSSQPPKVGGLGGFSCFRHFFPVVL